MQILVSAEIGVSLLLWMSEALLKSYMQEVILSVYNFKMHSLKYCSCISPSVNLKYLYIQDVVS